MSVRGSDTKPIIGIGNSFKFSIMGEEAEKDQSLGAKLPYYTIGWVEMVKLICQLNNK